eukprot:gene15350-18209_t
MTFVKGVSYDPQRAKESVIQTKEHLVEIEEKLKMPTLDKTAVEDIFKAYNQLPLTFQINWAVAGEDACENQKKADFCRDRLNELNHQYRFTQTKIPRAFNADNY